MSISATLQQFRGAVKIVLNQKFIDNKGAKQLAKFLESHGKVQLLQLKSNDISGIGFADIFKALTKNPNIRQLIIEHNRLGEQGEDVWPSYFNQFVSKCPRLQRLNASNNKLGRNGFNQMMTAICNSKNIKLLEIKYNQIPSSQINSFAKQLRNAANDTLLYVQLAGNKVQKQVQLDLDDVLKQNRQKNPIAKDNLMMTGGFMSNARGSQIQSSFSRSNAIDDLSKQNILRHLELLLEQNRKGTLQMKNKLQNELADLQRRQKLDAEQIMQMDKKCNQLIISNRNLKYQLDKTILQHQQIQRDHQFEQKVKEERILDANKELTEMELKYQQISNKMNRDHEMKLKQISRNWEGRLRSVEERIRDVQNDSNIVEGEIRKIVQRRQKLRTDYEEQQAILRQRIQQEQNQRYGFKLQALQSRLKQLQQSRQKYHIRGQDILYEFDTRQREGIKQTGNLQQDLNLLKMKEQQLVEKNKGYVTRNQNIKSDINLKEITIEKLEQEINRINQQIQLKKTHNRQQIDKIIIDHQYGRSKKADQKLSQIQKLNQLETTLRNYQLQNAKLQQEYMILQQKLQNTLSKAVQQVFTQSNLY